MSLRMKSGLRNFVLTFIVVEELPGISRLSAAYLHKSIMDINIVHNDRMEPTFREFILIIHTYYQVIQFALPLHYNY